MCPCTFSHCYVIGPKATEFGKITQTTQPLRRSWSPILVPIENQYVTSYLFIYDEMVQEYTEKYKEK